MIRSLFWPLADLEGIDVVEVSEQHSQAFIDSHFGGLDFEDTEPHMELQPTEQEILRKRMQ